MLLIHDIDEFPKPQNGCIVTIGKFDGVHLGHQLIFEQLKSQAAESDLASLVIVIEPHPEELPPPRARDFKALKSWPMTLDNAVRFALENSPVIRNHGGRMYQS